MNFKKSVLLLGLAAVSAAPVLAQHDDDHGRDRDHRSIPRLDHVFVIMMENHGYEQVIGNPNEPYLNSLINNGQLNFASNYFAVGHPSLTNYLEIVGGSNFGVRSDNAPNWGSATPCTPNIVSGVVNADGTTPPSGVSVENGNVCPISGQGKDAATPAIDTWNEISGPFVALADIDGVKSVPAAPTVGMTIADQLADEGRTWKSYQESLPLGSIYGVNYSNGTASNLTNFTNLAPLTSASVVQLYAVKHNPFAYFASVQEGTDPNNSLANVVGFDGSNGLYADLATGKVPDFAFIAPNQCDDQHGRSNADAFCASDPGQSGYTYGTQAGLNPGLIQQGDVTIDRLVKAIHSSPVWKSGDHSAIVIVWDENDYSGSTKPMNGLFPPQFQNHVVLTVDTNYGQHGVKSNTYYNSFSLLKSVEAGLGLNCLNHACDSNVQVMTDLFK